MSIQKVKCFIVLRSNFPTAKRDKYVIVKNNDPAEHKQWILNNVSVPEYDGETTFIDFELPAVIDASGWYCSKNNIYWCDVSNSGTIVAYNVGGFSTPKQKAINCLRYKQNNMDSAISIVDCTGHKGTSLDNQLIVSKWEW
jgi:hypothetical protein